MLDIRKTEAFKQTYKQIFGEELIYKETKPRNLEDVLTELKQIRKETEATQNAENDEIIDEVESINEEAESIIEE